MHIRSTRPVLYWALAAALALLLGVLATLQYRWLGEVSSAEKARLEVAMSREAALASKRFDDRLSELLGDLTEKPQALLGDPAGHLRNWRSGSATPDLIERVLRVSAQLDLARPRRAPGPTPNVKLEQLNEVEGQFVPIPWTPSLRPLMRTLAPQRRGGDRWDLGDVEPTLPAVIVHLNRSRTGRTAALFTASRTSPGRTIVVLVLNRSVLFDLVQDTVFDELSEALGANFRFRVKDHQGQVLTPQLGSNPLDWPEAAQVVEGRSRQPHVGQFPLLSLRPSETNRRQRALRASTSEGARRDASSSTPAPSTRDSNRDSRPNLRPAPGAWTLEIAHRDGTLQAVVSKTRNRNLLLSGAILSLLAGAVLLLLRSAMHDQRTATRQVDFIAGLTHELHTPLAAISSAGANLADGVVSDPKRVRQYGEMLKTEGARLGDLVGQALDLAGVESPLTLLERSALSVDDLVHEAASRASLLATEAQAEVEVTTMANAAQIVGDREALLRLLSNLLGNAIKYGGKQVRLDARSHGSRVEITVHDDGRGVDNKDVGRLFEPFSRGSSSATEGTNGAGLGLHLARRIAERHGGILNYLPPTADHSGTRFVLILPSNPTGLNQELHTS